MVVRIKPFRWFIENAVEDDEGDFWENEEAKNDYYNSRKESVLNESLSYISKKQTGKILMNVSLDFYNNHIWAIEEVLTQDEYPECFL